MYSADPTPQYMYEPYTHTSEYEPLAPYTTQYEPYILLSILFSTSDPTRQYMYEPYTLLSMSPWLPYTTQYEPYTLLSIFFFYK